MRIRTRRRSFLVAAVALLAGCGGGDHGPRLASADADALVSLAHRVGHEGPCAQARDIPALRARANAIVNAGRMPAALQEPLLSGIAALEEHTPLCVAPVPPTPVVVPAPAEHGHGKEHKHKSKHGEHDD